MTVDSFEISLPSSEEIRALIKEAGLTRAEAAALIHVPRRRLNRWVSPEDSMDYREMPLSAYELLLIKLNKHPIYKKVNSDH
ncbi:helix-turn-helix domain-containing protein [Zooshikella ganghwensis]|uniref:XRE family transcriptional regulator n=1 Tax=Zooshikella ganghwensis TaxID=202772 RepID=A0A4P9VJM9_9GAMM|nr:helix-turn-helix transcriptional regulator [Zooshikella ganghwensis]RDH41992.1 XRE family transcriptional regulator [Zooshikella ganghwensis]